MTDPDHRLQTLFDAFQQLHPTRDSAGRKQLVRDLETEVKNDGITVSGKTFEQYRESQNELARILAYLLMENGKVNSDLAMWRNNIVSEWELLRRHDLSHDRSRMPLYYAVRTYVARLKGAPDLRAASRDDRPLLSEIESRLSTSEIDRSSQLRDRVRELLSLLEPKEPDTASSSRVIDAARVSRRGVITAAVITGVGTILAGLLANLDQISSWFASKAGRTSAPRK